MKLQFQKHRLLGIAKLNNPAKTEGIKNRGKLRVFIPVATMGIIYEEICCMSITNMNPKASGGVHIFHFAGYRYVLCTRDNSTNKYYCTVFVIFEFH